jgi:prolyl oligopeptidase PreP (S9A serine peptidase family)
VPEEKVNRRPDPYRWLQNTSDPQLIVWMKAQND